MNELIQYIKSQRSIVISTHGEDGLWSTNIFYGYHNNKIYFISPSHEKHSHEIIKNPNISFANNWYNENDFSDRKGIQGTGKCYLAENIEDITQGVELHNLHFPQFKERITVDYILNKENNSQVWYIDIDFIKYWDDSLYGNGGTREFIFSKK